MMSIYIEYDKLFWFCLSILCLFSSIRWFFSIFHSIQRCQWQKKTQWQKKIKQNETKQKKKKAKHVYLVYLEFVYDFLGSNTNIKQYVFQTIHIHSTTLLNLQAAKHELNSKKQNSYAWLLLLVIILMPTSIVRAKANKEINEINLYVFSFSAIKIYSICIWCAAELIIIMMFTIHLWSRHIYFWVWP